MTSCPHPDEWLRHHSAASTVQCGLCGHVWVSREEVQRRNAQVTRSVMQQLGTLLGGNKPLKTAEETKSPRETLVLAETERA